MTIGLCVKNAEKTVGEAVASILAQDYGHNNLELIIVDGFSSDSTLKIATNALSGKNIKFKVFQEMKGLGFARELVARKAKGKYLVYVDGDMVMGSDFISKQVDFMENNEKVGIAIGKFGVYPKANWLGNLQCMLWMAEDQLLRDTMFSKPVRSTCCGAIFRAEALRQSGGFDLKIKGACEDVDIFCKVSKAGWLTYSTTDALFCDRRKENLGELWKEHFWYGYGGHYVYHTHKNEIVPRTSRLFDSIKAYKFTRKKIVFLAPLLYIFEKTAYMLGFSKSHIDGYGHKIEE